MGRVMVPLAIVSGVLLMSYGSAAQHAATAVSAADAVRPHHGTVSPHDAPSRSGVGRAQADQDQPRLVIFESFMHGG